ncbi:hypothetical protein H8E07_22525 [bacterium]|nr:hypothetical protein [bacterium]
MKRTKSWKWWLSLGSLACVLAAGSAFAQTKDLTIDFVDVVYEEGYFYVTPYVGLANQGHDPEKQAKNHDLDVLIEYGQLTYQLVSSVVQYAIDHHTCWNYQPGNCGLGECLQLYAFASDWTADCIEWPNFYNCGCKYTITPYIQPIPYEFGYQTMQVTVDPFYAVPETDESNNEVTIDLGPIPNDMETWSSIKSIYR